MDTTHMTAEELMRLRDERMHELKASIESSKPFGGADFSLVLIITIVVPAIALAVGWFSWQ